MRTDPEFLRAFRAGERDALREVYVQHMAQVDSLVRFGFTTKGPPPARVPGVTSDAAKDLVHDVFLKAFRASAREAYDGLRPYAPYLLRIAKNVVLDRYRRQKHERMHTSTVPHDIDAILAGQSELPAANPEEDGDFRALEARTQQFVAGLNAEQRQFVTLRFREELSQAEVATRMGVTRRRVRTLEERVLSGLRLELMPETPPRDASQAGAHDAHGRP